MIVHRLDRGPFLGVIRLNERGPWKGWYGISWSVGGLQGGQQGLGKAQAYQALYAAMLDYYQNYEVGAPIYKPSTDF